MNKCFITKLPSSVDNDNLPVLGQLKISWLKQNNLTNNDARAIGLATNDSIVVKVSGAHLTDNTLTSNLGNTKTITAANGFVWLYVSNDTDATLTIDNKYALTQINAPKQADGENSIYFDIKDIKYCTNLTALILSHTQVSGDIDNLAALSKLIDNINLKDLALTGDMSKIPAGVYIISQNGRKVTTNFTWTANGRQNATLLAMEGAIPFDTASMDNMLIDQATCTFKGKDSQPLTKIISVKGTRTSASDAAVTAIQSKGITITGVTKQA